MKIRPEQPFILYAEARVVYEGRASSTLNSGNYLIIHKKDGTLQILGGELCNPLNYQPPGAKLTKQNNLLISIRKNEKITIFLNKILSYQELPDWSIKKIQISKTEQDLKNQILNNLESILKTKILEIFSEFKTPVGAIDILAIDQHDIYHVIEVKRNKANLAACSQLDRYVEYFIDLHKKVKDYIASPRISSNALAYAQTHYTTWLQIDHSI